MLPTIYKTLNRHSKMSIPHNYFRLAIIGTAGRHGIIKSIDPFKYKKMCNTAKCIIDQVTTQGREVVLYSGGAALSDHVAVDLFNEGYVRHLTIYSPCKWSSNSGLMDKINNTSGSQFHDNGLYDWRVNPGKTANYYHREFSKQLNKHSLAEIDWAIIKGAIFDVSNGFHQRNSKIAFCDYLIAYGIEKGDEPKDGGTQDTWNKCTAPKVYIQID